MKKISPLEAIMLILITLLALALRSSCLQQSGWGAEYYTAAVRSMSMNWHNFLYNAFDPSGFISIDKPPVAIWLQVFSVKLFGFYPFSIFLPQILEGVGSVLILFHLVRRSFGTSAGLLSAFLLAITPILVAVNRTNNTDSCLVLILLLAAWPLLKAAEEGKPRYLFLSAALIGLAFNVKMLAAYIVLPTFFMVYFFGSPHHWQRRFIHLGIAMAIVLATSLPWVLLYELTPKESRPFVGGSRHNSMIELVVGHNAVNRFVSPTKRFARDWQEQKEKSDRRITWPTADATTEAPVEKKKEITYDVSHLFIRTPTGPLRLTDGQSAAQVAWLFPFAIAGFVVGIRRKGFQKKLPAAQLNIFLWGGWTLTYIGIYSYLGGIIHFYYLSTLAPSLAALAGIGITTLWADVQRKNSYTRFLPIILLMAAAWEIYIEASALSLSLSYFAGQETKWLNWLHYGLLAGAVIAAVLLVVASRPTVNYSGTMLRRGSFIIGILALLILPVAWSLSTVLSPGHGLLPSADISRLISDNRTDKYLRKQFDQSPDVSKLTDFLLTNHSGEQYLLSTSTTQLAAPIIINTGQPVLARGGFHGLDPAMTPEMLAQMAKNRQVRFIMIGDISLPGRKMGARVAEKPITDWVRSKGIPVDPVLWRTNSAMGKMQLYDLRSIQS